MLPQVKLQLDLSRLGRALLIGPPRVRPLGVLILHVECVVKRLMHQREVLEMAALLLTLLLLLEHLLLMNEVLRVRPLEGVVRNVKFVCSEFVLALE